MGGCNSIHSTIGADYDTPVVRSKFDLEDLPQELVSLVADHLLATNLPALICLSAASKRSAACTSDQRGTAAKNLVRCGWVKEMNKCHAISNQNRTLTLAIGGAPWACGTPLPHAGCCSLSMRVDRGDYGNMTVGVCKAAASHCAWGLDLSTGKFSSFKFPGKSKPEGSVQVMFDATGRRAASLAGRAKGAVIQIVVDCDEGTLAFGINGESPRRVPDFTFTPGTQLRPWARLYGYTGDQISMRGCVLPA